jgi:uncharacterized membrane protein
MAGSYVSSGQPAGKLVLMTGLLYVVVCFGVTMTFNQPLNLKLAALSPAQAVVFWLQYLETWMMWNHARTMASDLVTSGVILAAVMLASTLQ